MNRTLDIIVADSAGNVTIFVKTPCNRNHYQEIAKKLFAVEELRAEQVAFILPPTPNVHGKIEMSGLEFCGNAARAYALIVANEMDFIGEETIVLDISGYDGLLEVQVNTITDYTRAPMPRPLTIEPGENSMLLDFGGILHLVLWDMEATEEEFIKQKEKLIDSHNPPALGVMFYDSEHRFLTPVVYVADVNSTFIEGSCASGTVATAIAISHENVDGIYTYNIEQPAGELSVTLVKNNNQIESAYIEGPVQLGEPQTITI